MNYRVFRGPLYDEKPETKKYFTHNGQNYINTGAPETHFMTGICHKINYCYFVRGHWKSCTKLSIQKYHTAGFVCTDLILVLLNDRKKL